MSRLIRSLAALIVVVAACGGGAEPGAGAATGDGVASAQAVIGSTPPSSTPDGIEIPSVALTLADGSSFDFAEIDTPVMIVFWAEW